MKITPPEGYIIDEEQSTIYNIVFKKKKELPTTWEEFCTNYPRQEKEGYIEANSYISTIRKTGGQRDTDIDRNLLPSKEAAEAHLILMQLHQLRDVYRQGWVPDWENRKQEKWIIEYSLSHYNIVYTTIFMEFLSFQSEEIAKEFFNNFKDLIEKAGDLI